MEKNLIIKRIVYTAVCFVLVVASCVMFYDFNAVKGCEGSGSNEKITSMQDMGEMLEAFSPKLTSYDFDDNIYGVVEDVDGAEKPTGKFKSVTFSERSSAYINEHYTRPYYYTSDQYSIMEGFYVATYQRFMQVYITESATFYHTEFTLNSDAEAPGYDKDDGLVIQKSYSDITLDADIYISKDRALLRINNAHMAVDGVNSYMFEKVLGRWGEFTDDIGEGKKIISSFNSVNRTNFRILAAMGNCIRDRDGDKFTKKGDRYILKKDPFKDFTGTLLSIAGVSSSFINDEKLSGEFEVDLRDDTNPVVNLNIENEYELDKATAEQTKSTVSLDYFEYDVFEFSAINNTVIKGYDSVSALSADEYAELIPEEE